MSAIKTILITGGTRGLGRKLVETLAQEQDSSIYLTYAHSTETADYLTSAYPNVTAVRCNQKEEDQIRECIETVNRTEGRLDILINNACCSFRPSEILKSDWSIYQDLLDTNVRGAYFFMKEAAALMKTGGKGKMINILTSYVLGVPPDNLSHYITAKYALLGLSKAAAKEFVKYGITVNMVSPGLMPTDLSAFLPRKYMEACQLKHPMKRMVTPDDVAEVVRFLTTDASDFLNGVHIPVNGGEVY